MMFCTAITDTKHSVARLPLKRFSTRALPVHLSQQIWPMEEKKGAASAAETDVEHAPLIDIGELATSTLCDAVPPLRSATVVQLTAPNRIVGTIQYSTATFGIDTVAYQLPYFSSK